MDSFKRCYLIVFVQAKRISADMFVSLTLIQKCFGVDLHHIVCDSDNVMTQREKSWHHSTKREKVRGNKCSNEEEL